jgi:hypothetical protein
MKTEKTPIATISGSYEYGWQQMWKHFLYLFLVAVIVMIASAPMSGLQDRHDFDSPGMIALQIIVAAYALLPDARNRVWRRSVVPERHAQRKN